MQKIILKIALPILCLSCTSHKNKAPEIIRDAKNINYRKVDFDSAILSIDKGLDTLWTFNEEVLTDSEFINIYEHSNIYKDDAIKFITLNKRTKQQVKICILAMQNLELDSYIDFCNAVTILFERGDIPEYVLKVIIFPNFLKKFTIVKNYDNPQVIKLLERVRSGNNISAELKENITDILSGKN